MKVRNLLNGAISLTISALIVKIIGVAFKIPLSYIIGDEGMGYFNTAYSIYGVCYVISSAGVPKAITCLISAINSERRTTAYAIYRYSIKLFGIFGSIICAIYLAFSPIFVRLISNERSLLSVIVIGPSIIFVSIGGVCKGYLSSTGGLLKVAISQSIEALSKLVIGISFAYLGYKFRLNIDLISALAISGITIGSSISTYYLISTAKRHNTQYNEWQNVILDKKNIIKKLIQIAFPITLGAVILTLGNVIDVGLVINGLISSGLSNSEANQIYGNYTTLAVPMINLLTSLVTPLTVALLPRLINLKRAGNKLILSNEVSKYLFLTVAFMAPCVSIYYFYSFDVLDILFPSFQSAAGYSMLASLSLGAIFLSILSVINTLHESNGRFAVTVISLSLAILTKIVFTQIFLSRASLGINSIPLATSLSYLIGALFSLAFAANYKIKLKMVKNCILPSLNSFICYGLVYHMFYVEGFLGGGFKSFLLGIIISSIAYLFLTVLCNSSFFFQKSNFKQKNLRQKVEI